MGPTPEVTRRETTHRILGSSFAFLDYGRSPSPCLGTVVRFDLIKRISSVYVFLFALDAFIITSAVPQLLNECE
jgi:hypothetical protein